MKKTIIKGCVFAATFIVVLLMSSLFLNKGNTDMTAGAASRLYKYGRGTCEYDAWLPFSYGRKIYEGKYYAHRPGQKTFHKCKKI